MLLLLAAGLKVWPLVSGQAVETQGASLLKLILIQGEVLLALWLVSGMGAGWAFRTAIVFFTGAAAVNLRSIWLGEVSCGCFGKVEVPPWVSLGLNGVLLAALVWVRPPMVGGVIHNAVTSVRSLGWVAPACVLIVAAGAGYAFARSYFRPVVIEAPKEIDLGELVAGEKKEVTITLRNLSNEPVTILGAKSSCTCAVADGFPIESIRIAHRFLESQFYLQFTRTSKEFSASTPEVARVVISRFGT